MWPSVDENTPESRQNRSYDSGTIYLTPDAAPLSSAISTDNRKRSSVRKSDRPAAVTWKASPVSTLVHDVSIERKRPRAS